MSSAAAVSFLEHKRLAIVGVSRDARSFSRAVFRELRQRGYDVVPVNPLGGEIEGQPCARSVLDLTARVEGALLLTPPSVSEAVVRECARAGVPRVWMHQGAGPGSASPAAVAFCRENGIEVVTGVCPFMFLSGGSWIHHAHGWWRRRHVA